MLRFSPQTPSSGLLSLGFNQDGTCAVSAGFKGIQIFSLESHKRCCHLDIGAISVAAMLYCTSLVVWVGAGEQPSLTPRRLTLFNSATNSVIQHLPFPSSVLSTQLSRQHLCVILEKRAFVYKLDSLELVTSIDTAPNPKGLGALSLAPGAPLLALPASQTTGVIGVHDVLRTEGIVLEIAAHKSPLSLLVFNSDASLLASASTKGTVVRVHSMPQGSKAFTLRRGTSAARITSMAFTPSTDDQEKMLCVASDHATVHIFRLQPGGGQQESVPPVAKTGLSSVIPPSVAPHMAQRPAATVRLRCSRGTSVACAVLNAGGNGGSGEESPAPDELRLAVASPEGILYQYCVQGLHSSGGATSVLEGEWYLS